MFSYLSVVFVRLQHLSSTLPQSPSSPLQRLLIAPVFFCCFHIKVPHLTLEIRPACLYFSLSDGLPVRKERRRRPIMLSLSFPSRQLLFLVFHFVIWLCRFSVFQYLELSLSSSSALFFFLTFSATDIKPKIRFVSSGPNSSDVYDVTQSVLFKSVLFNVKQ